MINGVPFFCAGTIAYLLFLADKQDVKNRWHQTMALASVLFFQFFIYVGRSDFIHWKNSTPLYWILLAILLDEIAGGLENARAEKGALRWRGAALSTLLWMPIVMIMLGNNSLIYLLVNCANRKWNQVAPQIKTASHLKIPRLGNVAVPIDREHEVTSTVAWLKELVPNNGFFFDFTKYGAYYFLADKRNSTRFGLVNYIHGPAMTRECILDLGKTPPQAILVEQDTKGLVFRNDLQPIADYIERNFKLFQKIDRLAIFIPKKRAA